MSQRNANQQRRHVLQYGLSLAALGTLPNFAFSQTRPIRIGYVSPQTGPLAAFGETDSFTVKNIRESLKKGLTIGDKVYQVEIIVKDSQSNPNRAAGVAQELINNDKVDLMLCAATPDTTNPVSDQCELAGVPCISTLQTQNCNDCESTCIPSSS